ncbi:MAG TPA: hypothetical protein QF431_05500 [Acidimicrobiales bacterium]|nr:hypothetical protein [Acidimicrobiales bacterium]
MLLSSSSAAIEEKIDVKSAINGNGFQVGVPHANELIAFAEAAHRLDGTLETARENLTSVVGEKAMIDAAVTVSVFRSLNIAADSSGIRVDDEWEEIAAYLAVETSADRFPTSTNSPKVEARIHSMTNQK